MPESLRNSDARDLKGASDMDVWLGYTVATGRLFCDISVLHAFAERMLGRPIFTHEFGDEQTWRELRDAVEMEALRHAR